MKNYFFKISCCFVLGGLLIGCGQKAAETKTDSASTNAVTKAAETPTPEPQAQPAKKVRVLMIGGGASHDFERWFNQADSITMAALGNASVDYTAKPEFVAPMLKDADVLYICANQKLEDPAIRQGIFNFADAGKGMILVHPALWYNWKDWPEFNSVLAGGGSKSHGPYGEFEVTVTDAKHPVMADVPATFTTKDELYRFEPDPNGTPMEVLATGKNATTGETYPVVWITKHPKTRIVCITLGHDGLTHDSEPYHTLLKNSLAWVNTKK